MTTRPVPGQYAVVGQGRLGKALCRALPWLRGPYPRGFDGADCAVVVLAVPDGEIAAAAVALAPGPIVGHCSGATTLDPLAPHERFSLHPLMTVTADGADFAGAPAAVAGSTARALAVAEWLAHELAMTTVRIAEEDRAAYHAAASFAANFLITIEDAAATLLATTGADRSILLPLVRASVDSWERLGPTALTGPISRGDDATVVRQRAAVAEHTPELLHLFDVLVDYTRQLAARNLQRETS